MRTTLQETRSDPRRDPRRPRRMTAVQPPVIPIVGRWTAENGIAVRPDSRLLVTAGGNLAFVNAVLAITDPGDEVILPVPYYFNHEMAVVISGAVPVGIRTSG